MKRQENHHFRGAKFEPGFRHAGQRCGGNHHHFQQALTRHQGLNTLRVENCGEWGVKEIEYVG